MYCVSKAALESLTGAYQVELAKVSVSTCIPGEVNTDMQSDLRSGPQSRQATRTAWVPSSTNSSSLRTT